MTGKTRTTDFSLASDFPAATHEDWLKLVSAVLKGAPFDKKLVTSTDDGLEIKPLYPPAADAKPLAARAAGMPWQVLQRVEHPDAGEANAQARHDLENGASGLAIVLAGTIGAYGYGLDGSKAAIEHALAGIPLDRAIALECDVAGHPEMISQHFADFLKRQGIPPASINIRFGLDPLGASAITGRAALPWPQTGAEVAALIKDLSAQGFKGPFLAADARPVHAAGGSQAQELALALANATAYLRALETNGIALEDARAMIFFRLAADADQFLTIAKFRALRRLWAQIETACGLEPKPVFISAETAWRMMTKRDPWVNMLRTTAAAFAAGVGGADAITVLPFTAAIGLPDKFARRIARNTQLILLEEANLAKVTDPAAGSGAIEDMTKQLCKAAWALFQDIEAAGGSAAAFANGTIQRMVAGVRQARESAIAHRKDALTGTSEFPDIAEAQVHVLDAAPVSFPAPAAAGIKFEALPRIRLAEPYENLRDASDRTLAATGSRPKIFLGTLGPLSGFTARATYAKNLFEAGGIEAITTDKDTNRDEMVAAFHASDCKLVCLCSSDAIYEREAIEAVRALKQAGAIAIYVAGRPGALEQGLREAGVTGFVHVGCNVLATLQTIHGMIKP